MTRATIPAKTKPLGKCDLDRWPHAKYYLCEDWRQITDGSGEGNAASAALINERIDSLTHDRESGREDEDGND